MRKFESGAVRDDSTGKGRFDLLPWAVEQEVKRPQLVDLPERADAEEGAAV